MPERKQAKRIVVGVDGSAPSKEALAWAMEHAEESGSSVLAVLAWHIPANYGTAAMVLPAAEFADEARRELEKITDESAAERPGVRLERRVVEGHPGKVLLDLAEDADLLVVGSRGHGGFVGALIGSVSQYCATHARCPVVIIRP
ncbi:universal stress protein [Glycomyces sp. YM15]|uniref:universal stress protein n=1 Tax=Glycomyces sp. YM15 TaxID=2800446 RepID=UPI0019649C58|nr:universal stress protein [Glycomyces sp. YM15]